MKLLTLIQREMVLSRQRGSWDLVRWLAGKAKPLRLRNDQLEEL